MKSRKSSLNVGFVTKTGQAGDGCGKTHLVHTLDVSDHGVRLAGFRCELKARDSFELQYRHWRARFRVVRVAAL